MGGESSSCFKDSFIDEYSPIELEKRAKLKAKWTKKAKLSQEAFTALLERLKEIKTMRTRQKLKFRLLQAKLLQKKSVLEQYSKRAESCSFRSITFARLELFADFRAHFSKKIKEGDKASAIALIRAFCLDESFDSTDRRGMLT